MQEQNEIKAPEFGNSRKNDLIQKAYPEIFENLKKLEDPKHTPFSRALMSFGGTFETLVVTEETSEEGEDTNQKAVREIIEEVVKKSQLFLGSNTIPSTPDGISVLFDKNGKLVIKKILEVKTSEKALNKKPKQAQKTVETIYGVVSLLNKIISGDDINQITPLESISPKYRKDRIKYLNIIKSKLSALNISSDITFSENLVYEIVLPDGEKKGNLQLPSIVHGEKTIPAKIKQSQFSKKDVHKIIDHFSETN